MKFTKIPETTFKQLQLNAGVLLSTFAPSTAELSNSNILGATSGGVTFSATPSFTDFGADIDNCPAGMKELMVLDDWDIKMSGSFITADANATKRLLGAAKSEAVSGVTGLDKITPNVDLSDSDFKDIWWVGDYSDVNSEENGGFIAIHMLNALSTGGFSMTSSDKEKGKFDFEFKAHFSMNAQDAVPLEIYIKSPNTQEA